MPTISVNREHLHKTLGQVYTEDQFNDLCFEFGLELDEITSEREIIAKEKGDDKAIGASTDVIYKIDIPANRYDLLCETGLVRALLIFQGKVDIPQFLAIDPADYGVNKIVVTPNTKSIRPFVVCAILRNITFDQVLYDSFIDLQDKLHQNICRKRSLVAIGTHDLDTIKGPFLYDAKPPQEIKFVPLNETKEFNAVELMEYYSGNSHLKPYLPIIRDSPVYPVIYDANGVLLSLPPIINGNHSKIKLSTKNIFIECTATDENKASIVLDTIICMFSSYCDPQFQAEKIQTVYEESKETKIFPKLNSRMETVAVDRASQMLGVKLPKEEICRLLQRMGLKATPNKDNSMIDIEIPPTRHDILHACDIFEDVAISYGYNNIIKKFPKVVTIGAQFSLNKLSDQIRHELSRCGYTEALTFSLCSKDDIADKMRIPDEISKAVHIANPKTIEFQVARTSLIPGLLRTVESNKKMPLPLKLFEISDVVLKDSSKDVGSRNQRMLSALHYNKFPGFEVIHGLLDRIMQVMEIQYTSQGSTDGYYIESTNDERFLPGRCASIIYNSKSIGIMGVLHPKVITNFELTQPCSALEINVEIFLKR
ncbi:phenylalanine--tRNA ligase beta subunit-like [Panonychus citri]|uniref:phenylalanine--tRNA ligase beta subunit-like n=1 Tax=Panonychus citri TaxID=50023 RepID=UPI002307E00A|nr:phenylalanine--tRNA ligase beta subunit-like [Panonychus citri]